MATAREVLVVARKHINKPHKWTRGKYSNDKGRLSASGAVFQALVDLDDWEGFVLAMADEIPASRALRRVVPKEFDRLDDFNDQASHKEVLAVFNKAIKQVS